MTPRSLKCVPAPPQKTDQQCAQVPPKSLALDSSTASKNATFHKSSATPKITPEILEWVPTQLQLASKTENKSLIKKLLRLHQNRHTTFGQRRPS